MVTALLEYNPTSPVAVTLRRTAEAIADALVERVPGVECVYLFGSVARGDAEPSSDIDLLVVGSDTELTPTALIKSLPDSLQKTPMSLLYYSSSDLEDMYEQGDLFVAHVREEGKVLYDRSGALDRILHGPFEPTTTTDALAIELDRLRPYDDLEKFNGNLLFCLSHLYAIGKSVIMLGLAKNGVLEFNRDRAFAVFRARYPEYSFDVDAVARLRPFYQLVTGRRRERLPFPYIGAEREAQAAVHAIRSIAEVASGNQA